MTNEELQNKLTELFPEAEITPAKQFVEMKIGSDKLVNVAEILHNKAELSFDYLFCLSGMDYGDDLGIVYHLKSSQHDHSVVVKVKTGRENPNIDTVCHIWKTADFLEREVFDLFGIKFNNHPDLRRIFLDDDWVGHPLRKDYVDERNIVER